MRLAGVLAKIACGVLLLLNGASSAPTNSLQSRAAGSNKVIVGQVNLSGIHVLWLISFSLAIFPIGSTRITFLLRLISKSIRISIMRLHFKSKEMYQFGRIQR